MKRFSFIWIMLAMALQAMAQQGLAVNKVFEGQVVPSEKMVETRVRGRDIAKYQLSFFRSLRFHCTPAQAEEIFTLVEKEKSLKSVRSGSGYADSKEARTLMVQLPPSAKGNRFVCVKAKKTGKNQLQMILIYMEGKLDSLDKLVEILKN